MQPQGSDRVVRFGAFELNLTLGELRKSGIRVPVQGRPLQVLALLLRAPGELVTSEQMQAELWPADTFVDFEHGIRNAVARLRAALGDTAEKPRFVETVPRRGYRFIGAVAEEPVESVKPVQAEILPTLPAVRVPAIRGMVALVLGIAALAAIVGGAALIRAHFRERPADVRIKSLAVLPLENLSGNPGEEFFADGVTDELITVLAKIDSLSVTSRTSVLRYKGVHDKTLPQIAHELGVDAVLEGSLVRAGDRVRVTAQLIEASTDRHLWADSYDRSSRDVLLLESDIARAIAEQVRAKLSPQEERHLSANPIAPAAHEAYLRGLYLWNRRTTRALEEAVQEFTLAIQKDPHYAQAYAGRADAYIVLGGFALEALPPAEAFPKARADANQALLLDSNNSEAHTALAVVREIYEWDWTGAETEFRRSIELGPSNATAHQWYGLYLCNLGRFRECLDETARAHALDPAYLVAAADVGFRRYEAREYAEAIEPIRKVLEFNPEFLIGHRYLGQVYEANRMYVEGIAELRKAAELSANSAADLAALGHALAVSGHRAEAKNLLYQMEELSRKQYVSSYGNALIYAGLGEKDEALRCLWAAFQNRSAWMMKLKVDPRLDGLRSDARFEELLRRVGLR